MGKRSEIDSGSTKMESGVKMLYNGKPDIEKAKVADEDKLLMMAMAQNVEDAIEPLRSDIEKEGGVVTINLKGPAMFEISTTDLSDELKKKILEALQPPE